MSNKDDHGPFRGLSSHYGATVFGVPGKPPFSIKRSGLTHKEWEKQERELKQELAPILEWMRRRGAATWQLANAYFSVVPENMVDHNVDALLIDAGIVPGTLEFATLTNTCMFAVPDFDVERGDGVPVERRRHSSHISNAQVARRESTLSKART